MCGRFTATYSWAELVRLYRLSDLPALDLAPCDPVVPGTDALVIRERDGARAADSIRWGFRGPWWSKSRPQPINATAERLFESGMWREAARRARCIVPMTAFYEPRGEKGRGPRPQVQYRFPDDRAFSVAALWTRWRGEEGLLDSFALITTAANDTVAPVHPRMPAILEPGVVDPWLDPSFSDAAALRAMLAPWAGEPLLFGEVGPAGRDRP